MAKVSEWISLREASRILGVDAKKVSALAKNGVLSVRQVPGSLRKVSRSEVVRLSEQSVKAGTMAGGQPDSPAEASVESSPE